MHNALSSVRWPQSDMAQELMDGMRRRRAKKPPAHSRAPMTINAPRPSPAALHPPQSRNGRSRKRSGRKGKAQRSTTKGKNRQTSERKAKKHTSSFVCDPSLLLTPALRSNSAPLFTLQTAHRAGTRQPATHTARQKESALCPDRACAGTL